MAEAFTGSPLAELRRWLDEAEAAGESSARTMSLATTGTEGPHVRTVVARAVTDDAVRFHTSAPSLKSSDLAADPRCSAVFFWPSIRRQVVLTGRAVELPREVTRELYASVSRQLQLVAWAHEELAGLAELPPGVLERAFLDADGDPRSSGPPAEWTAFDVVPFRLDFWRSDARARPPQRTRYQQDAERWVRFDVLP